MMLASGRRLRQAWAGRLASLAVPGGRIRRWRRKRPRGCERRARSGQFGLGAV